MEFLMLVVIAWFSLGVGFIGGILCMMNTPVKAEEPLSRHGYMTITLDRHEWSRS